MDEARSKKIVAQFTVFHINDRPPHHAPICTKSILDSPENKKQYIVLDANENKMVGRIKADDALIDDIPEDKIDQMQEIVDEMNDLFLVREVQMLLVSQACTFVRLQSAPTDANILTYKRMTTLVCVLVAQSHRNLQGSAGLPPSALEAIDRFYCKVKKRALS